MNEHAEFLRDAVRHWLNLVSANRKGLEAASREIDRLEYELRVATDALKALKS
jgi:hypothetical protein